MIVLGFDTATAATAVALLDGDAAGSAAQRRHDPAPGIRPGHASLLLALAHELLAGAGLTFAGVDRIAVGLGPGGFTGLRIGVATARALAQAADAEIVGVSTLRTLAMAARPAPGQNVLAVVDARRGEVFAGGWRDGEQLLGPLAVAPAAVGELGVEGWLAVGDGALRFREDLEGAGCVVPQDHSPQHAVSAQMTCRLALAARHGTPLDLVVPDYLRKPDAKPRP
ncbi:MAG: tRNA threonylcarbamoyladenosine biosynthesis protein TsaB [bacterium]